MEADLQMVCRLNGSNLRDTGHSFEAGPMAALAEQPTRSVFSEWRLEDQ
jgi:hypothetical protein